jgi:hypothetical protein
MLPQLVGMSCSVCSQRIGMEIDGRFCEGCGNPLHNTCGPPRQAVSNDELLSAHEQPKCPRCGCDPKTLIARQVREVWLGHRAWKEMETEAPLLVASSQFWMQRRWLQFCAGVALVVLCAAIILVAVRGIGDDPEGALACVGVPWAAAWGLLYLAKLARKKDEAAQALWDQATDEKERARIERGEPPG